MKGRDFFILLFCFGALLFSIEREGSISLKKAFTHTLADRAFYSEHLQLNEEAILPPPIITDINGDGKKDLVVARDGIHVEIVSLKLDPRRQQRSGFYKLHTNERYLLEMDMDAEHISVVSGFTAARTDLHSTQKRVFLLTSDWNLLCLDEHLSRLWDVPVLSKHDPLREKTFPIDVSMLATPYRVLETDEGIVIVGFQKKYKQKVRLQEMEAMEEEMEIEEDAYFDLEEDAHYNYYAFDTKTGEFRWRHVVEDFQESEVERTYAYGEKRPGHTGEVHWRTFEAEILSHLPHRFRHQNDASMKLDRFTRYQDRKAEQGPEKPGTRHIPVFTGRPVAAQKKGKYSGEKPPNVIVSHVPHGVEVIHLYTGHALSQVAPLQEDVLFHDFDYSGTIDSARFFTASRPVFKVGPHKRPTKCAALLYTGAPILTEALFNTTICEPTSLFHRFTPEAAAPSYTSDGDQHPVSAVSPTLVRRWDDERQSHVNDVVYLTSNGMVTSMGPHPLGGQTETWQEFMEKRVMRLRRSGGWSVSWQTTTTSTWGLFFQKQHGDTGKKRVIGDDVDEDLFPSVEAFHPSESSRDDMILAVGRRTLNILTALGSIEAEVDLPGDVVAPVVFADLNNDGVQDIVVTVRVQDSVLLVGYTAHTHSGVSTLSVLVVALLVAMTLMYISTGIKLHDPYYVKKNPDEHRSTD